MFSESKKYIYFLKEQLKAVTHFLNLTHLSFSREGMSWGQGGGAGRRNILNILKLFPETEGKKKKQTLGGLAEKTNIVPKRGTDVMNHKVLITLLPAFFANELISGQSQMTHVNR